MGCSWNRVLDYRSLERVGMRLRHYTTYLLIGILLLVLVGAAIIVVFPTINTDDPPLTSSQKIMLRCWTAIKPKLVFLFADERFIMHSPNAESLITILM